MIHFMESISQPISAAPCPASHWCRFTPLFVSLGMLKLSQYIYPSLFIISALHKIFINAYDWNPSITVRRAWFVLLSVFVHLLFCTYTITVILYGGVLFIKGRPASFRTLLSADLSACQHQGDLRSISYKNCRL